MKQLDDDELLTRIKRDHKAAEQHFSDWRAEARELYDLVAGNQWAPEDEAKLREELRPIVTFNVSGKYVDAIQGLQINNRQDIRYYPREIGDAAVNELLTGAVDWTRDECDAEDEETDAFVDCLVCGVGVVEGHISFEDDPEGMDVTERRDPLEMLWDPRAVKKNFRDARWIARTAKFDEEAFVERWGEEVWQEVNNRDDLGTSESDSTVQIILEDNDYDQNMAETGATSKGVTVLEYQYWQMQTKFGVQTPFGTKDFSLEDWRKLEPKLKQTGQQYSARKVRKKCYYRAYMAGDTIIEHEKSPYQEGFTYHFITGKRDRNHNTWYGVGRAIRDPQKWTNKFFSSILHSVSSNAKGGLLAEENAFSDPRKAEADWSRPDSITYVAEGAISNGKIMPKPVSNYPQGMDKLMDFSLNSLPETSGLSLELIGMTNRQQAGVVEASRKQAAMTVISWAFDAMRRYYKSRGRQAAVYVREYLADGRLIRLVGEQGAQYVPLVREQLTAKFDVIVDESPTSTNQKERVWAVLQQILPSITQQGLPVPPSVLDYLPVPNDLAQDWKKMLQPDPKQEQAKQQQMQLEFDDKQADIAKKQSEAEENSSQKVLNLAKARESAATTGQKAAGE